MFLYPLTGSSLCVIHLLLRRSWPIASNNPCLLNNKGLTLLWSQWYLPAASCFVFLPVTSPALRQGGLQS